MRLDGEVATPHGDRKLSIGRWLEQRVALKGVRTGTACELHDRGRQIDVTRDARLNATRQARVATVDDQRYPVGLVTQVVVAVHASAIAEVIGVVASHDQHRAVEPRLAAKAFDEPA